MPSEELLTVPELARRLRKKKSWVIEQCNARTRERLKHPLPMHKLGREPRFVWSEVFAWITGKKNAHD
jgi:hypothetical protein